MEHLLIQPPTQTPPTQARYLLKPKARPHFNTILNAKSLLASTNTTLEMTCKNTDDDGFEITMSVPLRTGHIHDTLSLSRERDGLHSAALRRLVLDDKGEQSRLEEVDFAAGKPYQLPPNTYPEVMLPFLLRWQPFDGKTRALYAWINDRFVARVYYNTTGTTTITLDSGKRCKTMACLMYPDLNDWVPLGNIINKLAKPFMPKYYMWFSTTPPFQVVRFEGPYGPPGAPEIILELLDI